MKVGIFLSFSSGATGMATEEGPAKTPTQDADVGNINKGAFPFDAFQSDPPDSTATPKLNVVGVWFLEGRVHAKYK